MVFLARTGRNQTRRVPGTREHERETAAHAGFPASHVDGTFRGANPQDAGVWQRIDWRVLLHRLPGLLALVAVAIALAWLGSRYVAGWRPSPSAIRRLLATSLVLLIPLFFLYADRDEIRDFSLATAAIYATCCYGARRLWAVDRPPVAT